MLQNLHVTQQPYLVVQSTHQKEKYQVLIQHSQITQQKQEIGGAIYAKNNITCTDSNFTHNIAINAGGAIYSATSYVTADNSKFINNNATADNSLGGAIYAI